MSETAIQWTARWREPQGACKHVDNPLRDRRFTRCVDVTCEGCWVPGYTFNGWIGCEKPPESPECDHCYAESVSKRAGLDVWGPDAPRKVTGDAYWRSLERWNAKVKRESQSRGVFAFSMGDLFEGLLELDVPRAAFLERVERATDLDVMLLTKRPELVRRCVPDRWREQWPSHVWVGTTAGAPGSERRLVDLARVAALGAQTFVSVEPLLGEGPELVRALGAATCRRCQWSGVWSEGMAEPGARRCPSCGTRPVLSLGAPSNILRRDGPRWVIVGGESGGGARPLSFAALDRVIETADAWNVPVFVKQLGSRWAQAHGGALVKGAAHGQDPYRWPERYRRREVPRWWRMA